MSVDPNNRFHQASFYIEKLKYDTGPDVIEGLTRESAVTWVERILHDADIYSFTGEEMIETLDYYAENFSTLFSISHLLAKTIFVDGVLHGIAFAAGLKGEPPE